MPISMELVQRKCPCGKASRSDLERVRRGWFLKLISPIIPFKKYRCLACLKIKLVVNDSER
jgi:hypothetical protein